MKNLFLALFLMAFLSETYAADSGKHYVTGHQRITFRKGPGIEHKIIKMLETGEQLVLMEKGEEWSKFKHPDGVEGYAFNTLVTGEVPAKIKFEYLSGRYKALKEKNRDQSKEISELQKVVKTLESKLQERRVAAEEAESGLESLKERSQNFLQLEGKYQVVLKGLKEQTAKVEKLEENQLKEYMKWFLLGALILIVGIIIEKINSRKRYTSSIRL